MARAFAARLGCIAMVFGLLQFFFGSNDLGHTVIYAIGMLILFGGLGYVIGSLAEESIRQSVEANFRRSIEKSIHSDKSPGNVPK